jgi:hypothetical protein
MAELLLDSKIRFWVFLPIMAITFLVGIIKHYLFIFMSNDKTVEKQQIIDSQALIRSRLLRENGRFIPKEVTLFQRISAFVLYFNLFRLHFSHFK